MVRYIYITKNNAEPKLCIVSFREFCDDGDSEFDNVEEIFNDMTSNFDDLKFWNCEQDMHAKTVVEVVKKIEIVLNDLIQKGYSPRKWLAEDEESCTIPSWMWGHTQIPKGKVVSMLGRDHFNLCDEERIEILMFHLEKIMDTCKKYDETYKMFLKY